MESATKVLRRLSENSVTVLRHFYPYREDTLDMDKKSRVIHAGAGYAVSLNDMGNDDG